MGGWEGRVAVCGWGVGAGVCVVGGGRGGGDGGGGEVGCEGLSESRLDWGWLCRVVYIRICGGRCDIVD